MKTKLALLSATTVGLLMSTAAAYASGNNYLYITQTGNTQTATITQSGGSNNKVGYGGPFQQNNGAGSYGHNTLVVNQNSNTGSELASLGSWVSAGSGNSLTGYQSGSLNTAEIDQEGSNSSVNLQQSGKGNGPSAAGWFNSTFANLILQDYTTNYSSVSLVQSNGINATNSNGFNIGQGGYNNHVTASQTGFNKLWIRQGTTLPDLWGWTWGNPFSPAVTAYSLASLSNSSITVNQTVGGSNPGEKNYAALGQGNGSGNSIAISQTGGSNSVDSNQVGSGNIFSSTQSSSNGNTWAAGGNFVGGEAGWPNSTFNPLTGVNGDFRPILQQGNNNQYYSVQSGTNLLAFGNQIGSYNFLSNTQSGDRNTLYSSQLGDSNTIYSVQAGNSNVTTVSQLQNGNYSNSSQNGSNNTATISQ